MRRSWAAWPLLALAAAAAPLREVAPGIHERLGVTADATAANDDAIANIGYVAGRDAIAVIDPGGSLADGEALRREIRAETRLPIRYVIITHVHPDHLFGAAAFAADHPVFVGHARMPGEIAARGEYYRKRLAAVLGDARAGTPVTPTRLVTTTDRLDLGGRTLELRAWPTAHTDTDLTVYDPATRTLWAGDLLFVGRIPSVDGSVTGWLAALDALDALPAVRAIPGHGPVSVPWPAGAADERRYLTRLRDDVRADIRAGRDIDEAARTAAADEKGRWALFDDYNGHNVTVAYKELEWE